MRDVPDEDLNWVLNKVHYFLLKLLEEADYDPAEDDSVVESIGLTD